MRQPGPKPAGSTWIYFHPPDLPPSVEFFHKIVDGHVQLQFSGTGARFNEMRATYASRLEEGMTIEPTGKSVAIRIAVPPSSFAAPFAGQEPIAEKALDSAARLLKWYLAQVAPST